MSSKNLIANSGEIACRVIRTARRMGIAMAVILALGIADTATACSVLTPAGERHRERRQQRYLDQQTDRVIIGTFRADASGREQDEDFVLRGVIEVERRGRVDRYRVSISDQINCGFPNYYVNDGDYGRFFLKRDEHPEDDDRADGVIDNYNYVHFESLEQPN